MAEQVLRLGPGVFGPDDLVVMGIINRTPDSFYDRGATYALQAALDRAAEHVAAGAAILDIGGVKAGPGDPVTAPEELSRTRGLVVELRARHPQVVLSVDTWRAEVAEVLLADGADLVNDTWGGVDPRLAEVVAAAGAGLVCAHAGGLAPRTRPHRIGYTDVVADVLARTGELAQRAVAAGVRPDAILVDPAHDFGKNSRHSLELTRRLAELVATGWPVLVALSRKDFIGETLDLPPEERLEGTLAATAICAWLGARVFRSHDVAATRRVLDTVATIRGTRDVAVARRGLA
ncbi:MAG: dihydropteroate synthase [Mycobacteriales bacterium]